MLFEAGLMDRAQLGHCGDLGSHDEEHSVAHGQGWSLRPRCPDTLTRYTLGTKSAPRKTCDFGDKHLFLAPRAIRPVMLGCCPRFRRLISSRTRRSTIAQRVVVQPCPLSASGAASHASYFRARRIAGHDRMRKRKRLDHWRNLVGLILHPEPPHDSGSCRLWLRAIPKPRRRPIKIPSGSSLRAGKCSGLAG